MKVVIIEDEELAAKRLEKMILEIDPLIQVVAKLESVEESVAWFKKNTEPDLLFLDIHLEDDISFAIFDKVKVGSSIIFTTAYDEYAIRAFKLKSIDYLLKPVRSEDLKRALDKFKDMKGAVAGIDMNALIEIITKKSIDFKDRFSVSIGQKIKFFSIDEIAYFYSEESITFLMTNDNHSFPIDFSLDELSQQLNPKFFFRINRQMIVKIHSIKNVHVFPKSHLKLELTPAYSGEVFVSIDKVTKFKAWLEGTSCC